MSQSRPVLSMGAWHLWIERFAHGRGRRPHYYRTASGDEIDVVLVRGGVPEVAVA